MRSASTRASSAPGRVETTKFATKWPRCIFCPRPLPRDGRRVRDSRNQLVQACCYLCAGRSGEPPSEWQRQHTRNCQDRADRVRAGLAP